MKDHACMLLLAALLQALMPQIEGAFAATLC
jgi:hypothetical protein